MAVRINDPRDHIESRGGEPAIDDAPLSRTEEQQGDAARLRRVALARHALLHALVLGIAGDSLLRAGLTGLGMVVWMLLFAASVVTIARRRTGTMRREHYAWLGVVVLLAAGMAWRGEGRLQFYDFLGLIAVLALLGGAMASGAVHRGVLGTRVRDLVELGARGCASVAVGVIMLVGRESALAKVGAAHREKHRSRARVVARGLMLALPLVLVFGYLLASADPMFERLVRLPAIDFGTLMGHLVVAGFFAWVTAGWMRGALVDPTPRQRMRDGMPFVLGATEIGVGLGALAALFGVFVAVQVGWLFGGEALVRSATKLSYAEYARRGFYELVWVALLSVPVLVVTAGAIAEEDAAARRLHRGLAWTILVLLGAIVASALGRMRLYVHYYGLSTDRVLATVFMFWIVAVLVWLAATVLRGRARDFAAGMTITGVAALAAVNVVNVDAFVARGNLARGREIAAEASISRAGSPVDYAYLATGASADAADVVVSALLAPPLSREGTLARMAEVKSRCHAVRDLLRTLRKDDDDWRSWNAGAARRRAAVTANEPALRGVTCWDAEHEQPFGNRESRRPNVGEQDYDGRGS